MKKLEEIKRMEKEEKEQKKFEKELDNWASYYDVFHFNKHPEWMPCKEITQDEYFETEDKDSIHILNQIKCVGSNALTFDDIVEKHGRWNVYKKQNFLIAMYNSLNSDDTGTMHFKMIEKSQKTQVQVVKTNSFNRATAEFLSTEKVDEYKVQFLNTSYNYFVITTNDMEVLLNKLESLGESISFTGEGFRKITWPTSLAKNKTIINNLGEKIS